jgi:hypothetical protein
VAIISLAAVAVLVSGGLCFGAYLALRKVSLLPATTPFRSLAVTLRPLLLPLFAVAIVGLVHFSWWAPLAGSILLGFVAIRLIAAPEATQIREAESWDRQQLRRLLKHAAWLVPAIVALTVLLREDSSQRSLESIGGVAADLLVLALALWVIAFALRFVSYASSWLKLLVAIFVVLTGLRLAAEIGLVPGGDLISRSFSFLNWLLPVAAAAFLLLEAALDVVAAQRSKRGLEGADTSPLLDFVLRIRSTALRAGSVRLFQGLGLTVAFLAAGAMLVSGAVGLHETAQPGTQLATKTTKLASDWRPAPAPDSFGSDMALARAYSPVLAFTRDERWSPISVDSYVRGAALSGPMDEPPSRSEPVEQKLDRNCPRLASAPCYRLSIHCKNGRQACAEPTPHEDRNNEGLHREGAVYVRVVRKPAEEKEERRRETEGLRNSDRWPPKVFVDEGPYAKSLTTLLQYWYFYRYDEWEAHAFAGQLVQRHEGDWEAVTIGLSDREPLFVGYSAHCAGTWVRWDEAELSRKVPRGQPEPTHPVVAVAEGSHANYPEATQKRSPDWAHCQGAPAGTTTLLSYASNIRDKTEYGWQWYPPKGGWLPADHRTFPMSFPGYWGASESATLYGFFKKTTLGESHGPETPSEQPLWRSPVTKIFCGNYQRPQLPRSLAHYPCKEG